MKNDMTKEITPNVRKRMDEFDTLQKIVDQLEWCNYVTIGGPLESNVAFMKLKEMAITASRYMATLEKGIAAVAGLINSSHGVYGLHLNNDPAPWDELQMGGTFEEWLKDFDLANAAMIKSGGQHEK